MSSRAAAAAAHKSKTQTSVMPASQASVQNDSQPTQKLSKRFAFISFIFTCTLFAVVWPTMYFTFLYCPKSDPTRSIFI